MTNILLLGDSGVGKSTYLSRLVGGSFSETYITTLGKDMNTLEKNGRTIFIHDIGGSDRFSEVTEGYYKCADGALIFYDTTDVTSYSRIKYWKTKLPEHTPVVIVANKNDIQHDVYNTNHSISCKQDKTVETPLNDLIDKIPTPSVQTPTILGWVWEWLFYYLGVIR